MEQQNIIDQIVEAIEKGTYEPDQKLPSENEMVEMFKVPRMTIRKAYERLQEFGYIYSKQGRGSFVKDRRKKIPLVLSGNVSFSEKMKEQGYQLVTQNVFCDKIDYNHKIYNFLSVDSSDEVYRIGRLRFVDDMPIALHISYVAQSVFPHIAEEGSTITSMFSYYEQQGFSGFISAPSLVSVVFPKQFERELLQCTSLVPLLELESGCLDEQSGTMLEFVKIIYRSDHFVYEFE